MRNEGGTRTAGGRAALWMVLSSACAGTTGGGADEIGSGPGGIGEVGTESGSSSGTPETSTSGGVTSAGPGPTTDDDPEDSSSGGDVRFDLGAPSGGDLPDVVGGCTPTVAAVAAVGCD